MMVTEKHSEAAVGITALSLEEIDAVSGAGFLDWLSHVTDGLRVVIFGVEISDGECNTHGYHPNNGGG